MTHPESVPQQNIDPAFEERLEGILADLGADDETPFAYAKTRERELPDGQKQTQTAYVMAKKVMDLIELCPVSLDGESDESLRNTLELMRMHGEAVVAAGDGAVAKALQIGEMMIKAKHKMTQGE